MLFLVKPTACNIPNEKKRQMPHLILRFCGLQNRVSQKQILPTNSKTANTCLTIFGPFNP